MHSAAGRIPEALSTDSSDNLSIESISYINVEKVSDSDCGELKAVAKLFGVVPLKQLSVNISERQRVIPSGIPVGITVDSEGVLIVSTNDVSTENGTVNPGKLCGLKGGDAVLEANGEKIVTAVDLTSKIAGCNGEALKLLVRRADGSAQELELHPVYSKDDGCYRAGIWIRESAAGIGALTFIMPETNEFCGLGHAICDSESGAVLVAEGGSLNNAVITGVRQGVRGVPGELLGYLGEQRLGEIKINSETGVYGEYYGEYEESKICETAFSHEIKTGDAQLLCCLPGESTAREYSVEIIDIDFSSDSPTRNMVIRITDENLLDATGGIVQGMSGSPIIQNGRVIGAVTHVFINDPTKGYGIFIENMLAELQGSADKAA